MLLAEKTRFEYHAAFRALSRAFPLILAFISLSAFGAPGDLPIRLETRQTHTRLSLRIDNSVPIQFQTSKVGFELLFKGISLGNFGAPLGQEARWKADFEKLTDSRMGSLKFEEVDAGVKVTGKWKFPTGANALADPLMEHFDYRDKGTSGGSGAFVVDFWLRKGPTLAEFVAAKKQVDRFRTLKDAEEGARLRAERRSAMEKLKAQTQDTMKFCRDSVTETNDVFLDFNPIHQKVEFSKWLPVTTPDANYTYYEPKTGARDAQYMRLALKLYHKSKYGLVVRTLDFLDNEFPSSTFRNEARFLRANTFIKLAMHEDAERLLKLIQAESKETPAALYTGMYLANRSLSQKNYLGALEGFQWLVQHHPDHRLIWMFHLGAAESLYFLRQSDRAVAEYRWVQEHAPTSRLRAEAALKIGDMALTRLQHEQALASYYQGITQFPEDSKEFPSAWINRAEAFYRVGEFERADKAFQQFLNDYPGHPSGWRAAFRLGEIHGRLDATPETQKAARHWYFETINRFPLSAGATLARLRLLPCSEHAGMSFETAKRFYEHEAVEFARKQEVDGEVQLARYRDLKALSRFRAMISMSNETVAVSVAVEELRSIGQTQGRVLIEKLLGSLFRKSILTFLAEGRKFDALRFYHEKGDMVPKDRRLLDSDFLLKLSQAASDLHLAQHGLELFETYREARAKADAAPEAQKKPFAPEDMDAILERSEEAFTEAKALWILRIEAAQPVRDDRARIRELLAKVEDESPFSFEREVILGLLEEVDGKKEKALRHAVRAQLLMPDGKAAGRDLRVEGWLASLEARAGDAGVSLQMYRNLENVLADRERNEKKAVPASTSRESSVPAEVLGVPSAPGLDEVIMAQGEIFDTRKDWGQAAKIYAHALELGLGGSKAEYGLANAMLEAGEDRQKALAALEKLGDDSKDRGPAGEAETPQDRAERRKKQNFWKQLARERLANEKSRNQIDRTSN